MHTLLRGPKLKVNRAKEHLAELVKMVQNYAKNSKVEIIFEVVDKGTIVRARLAEPVPDMIDVLSGEVLFNLRSALDQVACASLLRDDPAANLDYKDFPITDKNNRELRVRIKKLPVPVQNVIKRLKPYKDGNKLLWALHKLNNIDKHRTFVPIGSILGDVVISHAVVTGTVHIQESKAGDLSIGSQVFFAENTVFDPDYLPQINVGVNIAFSGLPEISSSPLAQVLNEMTILVDKAIRDIETAYFV